MLDFYYLSFLYSVSDFVRVLRYNSRISTLTPGLSLSPRIFYIELFYRCPLDSYVSRGLKPKKNCQMATRHFKAIINFTLFSCLLYNIPIFWFTRRRYLYVVNYIGKWGEVNSYVPHITWYFVSTKKEIFSLLRDVICFSTKDTYLFKFIF